MPLKILSLVMITLCVAAEDHSGNVKLPDKLSEKDARTMLSLQVSLAQAQAAYEKARADGLQAEKLVEAIKIKLQAEMKRLQDEANCTGCDVDPDLKWIRPKAVSDTSKKP